MFGFQFGATKLFGTPFRDPQRGLDPVSPTTLVLGEPD
jgi:hypothetical protein